MLYSFIFMNKIYCMLHSYIFDKFIKKDERLILGMLVLFHLNSIT